MPGIEVDPIVGQNRPGDTPDHTHIPGADAPIAPHGAAVTTVATLPVDDAPELYAALCAPGVRFQPLRYSGPSTPHAHRPAVAAAATVADCLRDGWALVAPLSPDLVVLDLDGCARGGLLEALESAAVEHDAVMAYRAASGSPDSEHHAYAVPEISRAAFRAAVAELRRRYGADGHGPGRCALEDRTADHASTTARRGRGLRLPLSPSLKQAPGAPVVWPLDSDGCPVLSLRDAARRVREARQSAGMPSLPAPAALETGEQDTPAPSSTRRRSTAHAAAETGTRRADLSSLTGWPTRDRDAVMTAHPRGRRSHGALEAMRAVVRRAGWSWAEARPIVLEAPAFRKWSARGERTARRWWERETARYSAYLEAHGREVEHQHPEASDSDRERVSAWLEASYPLLWSALPVERAARAFMAAVTVGQRRMLDGRGLEARPVAVRDLVVWGAAESVAAAWRVLRDLETVGVLRRASEFTTAAPLEAVRWSVPGALSLPEGEGDSGGTCGAQGVAPAVLSPALTSDGSGWMRPTLRVSLLWCLCGPLTARGLSEVLRCEVRSARRLLSELEAAGLVERSGAGVWSATVEGAEVEHRAASAPGAAEAVEALEGARARVEVERSLWRSLWERVADAAGRVRWRFYAWRRRTAAVASPERVSGHWSGTVRVGASAELLEAVATAYGGRDGWPDGGEAALFGVETLLSASWSPLERFRSAG